MCVFSIRFFLKKKDIVLIYTEIESPELLAAFETIDVVGSSEISIALIAYIFFFYKKGVMEHTLSFFAVEKKVVRDAFFIVNACK